MSKPSLYFLIAGLILCTLSCHNKGDQDLPWAKTNLLFEDTGTNNWQGKWMLDGQNKAFKAISALNTITPEQIQS